MIYNPYTANMINPGWQGHPDSMNQSEPQNYNPRQRHGYPQANWGMPAQGPYVEAVPYAGKKPYEKESIEEVATKKQATIEPEIKHREYDSMKEEMVYIKEKPGNQEKFMMEKEHHTDYPMPHHKKSYAMEIEEVTASRRLTCENLPLATTYVRSQPYQNLNSPAETLRQGTLFNDLYRPYVPRKVAQGGRR